MDLKTESKKIFPGSTIILLILLLLVFGNVSEAAEIVTKSINFTNEDIILAGELTLPAGEGPFPGIVMFSGSGPQDRDGQSRAIPGYRPFAVIAEHLAGDGYAVLRYDERGVGESSGDYISAVEDDFIRDAESAVRFLMSQNEIEEANVGVLGHSEGAMIAAQAASHIPEVVFVISLAGGAVDGRSLLLRQAQRQAEAEGTSREDVEGIVKEQSSIFDLVLTEDWQQLKDVVTQAILRRLEALPSDQAVSPGDLKGFARKRAEQSVKAFMHPRYQYLLNHDFAADWAAVSVPVLALYGELDIQCDAEQNIASLQKVFSESGNNYLTTILIPEANHLFLKARTGSMNEYTTLPKDFAPGVLESISSWLSERINSE